MENTLENEMLDAAISWCDSNGINVLEPEQLSNLVNSLYVTVCDAALDTAQPEPVNAMLVEALKALLSWVDAYAETSDAEFPDIEAKAEAALTAAKQAQPPAPSEAVREYMTGYSDGREWAGATNQAQPSQARELSDKNEPPFAWWCESSDCITRSSHVLNNWITKGIKAIPLYK